MASGTEHHDEKLPLRDRLLAAAAVEISEVGLEATSLRSIARRVGVSHQAPAHLFTNKSGMLTALAARTVDLLGDTMEAVRTTGAANGRNGKQVVVDIGSCYIEFAVANPHLFDLTGRTQLVDHSSPALRGALDRTWNILTAAVQQAQREGWRSEQPSATVATMCWSLVHGLAGIEASTLYPAALLADKTPTLISSIADLL